MPLLRLSCWLSLPLTVWVLMLASLSISLDKSSVPLLRPTTSLSPATLFITELIGLLPLLNNHHAPKPSRAITRTPMPSSTSIFLFFAPAWCIVLVVAIGWSYATVGCGMGIGA